MSTNVKRSSAPLAEELTSGVPESSSSPYSRSPQVTRPFDVRAADVVGVKHSREDRDGVHPDHIELDAVDNELASEDHVLEPLIDKIVTPHLR